MFNKLVVDYPKLCYTNCGYIAGPVIVVVHMPYSYVWLTTNCSSPFAAPTAPSNVMRASHQGGDIQISFRLIPFSLGYEVCGVFVIESYLKVQGSNQDKNNSLSCLGECLGLHWLTISREISHKCHWVFVRSFLALFRRWEDIFATDGDCYRDQHLSKCRDTPPMQSLLLKPTENYRRVDGKIVQSLGTCCKIVCSIYDRKASTMNSQQYGCLSKISIMTKLLDMSTRTEGIPYSPTPKWRSKHGYCLLRENKTFSKTNYHIGCLIPIGKS